LIAYLSHGICLENPFTQLVHSGQYDFVPQRFQSFDQIVRQVLRSEFIQIVVSQFAVIDPSTQHMVDDDQQRMCHRKGGSLFPASLLSAKTLGKQGQGPTGKQSCPKEGSGPYHLSHPLSSQPLPFPPFANTTKLSVGTAKFSLHKFPSFNFYGYGKGYGVEKPRTREPGEKVFEGKKGSWMSGNLVNETLQNCKKSFHSI
jgi:hypothetical protein